MAPVEAEHPPTARFSLQKKMSTYFIFHLDQCPAAHGWRNSLRLKLNRTEHYTDKLLEHLMMVLILHNRTHHPCNILTLNSPSREPEAAVGLCMGISDKPECQRLLLGNSRGLNMAPQNGEAEEQLCLRPVGQDQPGTEPSAGTWQQLQSRASQEKHTLGSHRLLETMWQCHVPAGDAGTFRMHQMLRTPRDVNDSGEKINAESNSKDLIKWMAIKPESFSLGKHQLCPALRTKCPLVTLPRARKVCWGVHCCQENS